MKNRWLVGTLGCAVLLAIGCGSNDSSGGTAGSGAGGAGGTIGASGSSAAGSMAVGQSGSGGSGGSMATGTPVTCGSTSCPAQSGTAAMFGQVTCCLADNTCGVMNSNLGGACEPPASADPDCPAPTGMLAGLGGIACCVESTQICGVSIMGSQCFGGNAFGGGGGPQTMCDGTPIDTGADAGI